MGRVFASKINESDTARKSSGGFFDQTPASQQASKPASQQASKPASQQASKPASQQASKPAINFGILT